MTGHPLKETPQLDRMAQEGIFFTDFYTRSFLTKLHFDDFHIRSFCSSLMLASIKPINIISKKKGRFGAKPGDSALILQLEKTCKASVLFIPFANFCSLEVDLVKTLQKASQKSPKDIHTKLQKDERQKRLRNSIPHQIFLNLSEFIRKTI